MKQRVAGIIVDCIVIGAVLAIIAAVLISCNRNNGTLTKIDISPANPSIANGYSLQLYGTATLSDGITYQMAILTWSSSDTGIATVSSTGLVTAVSNGTTTITANETDSQMHLSSTTLVTVANIESIAVTPFAPRMTIGTAHQFNATATLSNQATQDLSLYLTWSSSDTGIATVASTPGTIGNGLVTAGTPTPGSTFITAIDVISNISSSTLLTVKSAPLASITVTPADTSISIASVPTATVQFTAMGTYADGTTWDLTSSATWTTSNMSIATSAGTPGSPDNGLFTAGTTTGTVTITATDQVTAGAGSTTLTVF